MGDTVVERFPTHVALIVGCAAAAALPAAVASTGPRRRLPRTTRCSSTRSRVRAAVMLAAQTTETNTPLPEIALSVAKMLTSSKHSCLLSGMPSALDPGSSLPHCVHSFSDVMCHVATCDNTVSPLSLASNCLDALARSQSCCPYCLYTLAYSLCRPAALTACQGMATS